MTRDRKHPPAGYSIATTVSRKQACYNYCRYAPDFCRDSDGRCLSTILCCRSSQPSRGSPLRLEHRAVADGEHDPRGACALWVGENPHTQGKPHVIPAAVNDFSTHRGPGPETNKWSNKNDQTNKQTKKYEQWKQGQWKTKNLRTPRNPNPKGENACKPEMRADSKGARRWAG